MQGVVFVEDQGWPNFQHVATGALDTHEYPEFAHSIGDSRGLFRRWFEGRVVAYQFHADEQAGAAYVADENEICKMNGFP